MLGYVGVDRPEPSTQLHQPALRGGTGYLVEFPQVCKERYMSLAKGLSDRVSRFPHDTLS
jgi:hypothetical protein